MHQLHLVSVESQLGDKLDDVVRLQDEVATPLCALQGELEDDHSIRQVADQDPLDVAVFELFFQLEVACF